MRESIWSWVLDLGLGFGFWVLGDWGWPLSGSSRCAEEQRSRGAKDLRNFDEEQERSLLPTPDSHLAQNGQPRDLSELRGDERSGGRVVTLWQVQRCSVLQ